MSSCVVYSKCRIQFNPKDRQSQEHDYSGNSLVQLREHDFINYSLRALDNMNAEIFNIPLRTKDQYEYGRTEDDPDRVHADNGIFKLWLDITMRDRLHATLKNCYEILDAAAGSSKRIKGSNDQNDNAQQFHLSDDLDDGSDEETHTHNLPLQDLLLTIQNLNTHVKEGNKKQAIQLALRLVSQHVRLRTVSDNHQVDEQSFIINVQLDGNEYGIDQHGGRFPIDVYRSTTVRELRAAFELVYQYAPANQYFFVNGKLTNDNATMRELNVGPNSLFVLFYLSQLKSPRSNGPWKCSVCQTNNNQSLTRCSLCAAECAD